MIKGILLSIFVCSAGLVSAHQEVFNHFKTLRDFKWLLGGKIHKTCSFVVTASSLRQTSMKSYTDIQCEMQKQADHDRETDRQTDRQTMT